MTLDNSAFTLFQFCPLAYYERYVKNIEPARESESLAFGTRVHELLAEHFGQPAGVDRLTPLADEALEAEALEMVAAYKQRWPLEQEEFTVIDVERTFCVPIDGTPHQLIGKFDGIIWRREDGRYYIFEHKTEKAGGRRNLPEAWASRNQVSLYIWAAEKLYNAQFGGILLDVLTRRTPKGQKPCAFRRDRLVRTDEQKQQAIHDFTYVADQIDELRAKGGEADWRQWPGNRDNCYSFYPCQFRDLHLYGRDENQLVNFREAEPYLDL